jgi:hypothetical protein
MTTWIVPQHNQIYADLSLNTLPFDDVLQHSLSAYCEALGDFRDCGLIGIAEGG